MSIIQTGSIALLAFIVGDYMSELFSLGRFSSSIYATLVVVGLTLVNIIGAHVGTGTQKLLVSIQFVGLFVLIVAGLFYAPETSGSGSVAPVGSGITSAIGGAMVMVLLTFGGWNEAGYISSEMRGGSNKIALVMIASIVIITAIYLLLNLAYLNVLGIDGSAASEAVGVEAMRVIMGDIGVFLIIVGSFACSGFESMVDFTAPIFWFFISCTGIALFVLRYKEPYAPRPFRVPLYPVLPVVFCLTSLYMLYASLMFAGRGAWLGVTVLLLGTLFFFSLPKKNKKQDPNVL